MFEFNKNHDVLVLFDNDGTIMDTMVSKHRYALFPAFLEVFNIEDNDEKILSHWMHVNLFTSRRGVNRFLALEEIIRYLDLDLDDKEDFFLFTKNSKELSPVALKKAIEDKPDSKSLFLAYKWTIRVNEKLKELKDPQIFENAKETLKMFASKVDYIGVSTANRDAIIHDWKVGRVIDYFAYIGSQEDGIKSEIIKNVLNKGYKKENVVMVGDAPSDYLAAKENDIRFFPIIPSREKEYLIELREAIIKLLNHSFDDRYQQELLDRFNKSLIG